jgi:hypothetical protein
MAITTTKSQNHCADNTHKYDCISQKSLKFILP